MTREFQQMLKLAAIGATGHAVDMSSEDIDWQKVLAAAKRQKVEYLVAYALKRNPQLLCPSEIRDPLLKEARTIIFSNAVHKRGIFQLLEDMEAAGIPAVLLKGYAIADCYELPESRMCGDADIWINPKDEDRACEFMKAQGFTVEPRWKNGHHAVCNHPMLGCVELHVILYDEIVEDVWFGKMDGSEFVVEHYLQVTVDDGKYQTLGYTDHFIFLALHMIKHFILSGLTVQMMLDVALYFKQHAAQIDGERVWNTINSLHYGKLLNCILWAMIRYCGFKQNDFPGICEDAPEQIEEILSDLEDGGWMGWEDKFAREEGWQEYNRQVLMENQSKLQYFLYMLRWKSDLYWKALFPSRKVLANKYPYVRKSELLIPVAWLHRLVFRGSKAVKKGALTSHIVTDEQKVSAAGKTRVQMFRKLEMMK